MPQQNFNPLRSQAHLLSLVSAAGPKCWVAQVQHQHRSPTNNNNQKILGWGTAPVKHRKSSRRIFHTSGVSTGLVSSTLGPVASAEDMTGGGPVSRLLHSLVSPNSSASHRNFRHHRRMTVVRARRCGRLKGRESHKMDGCDAVLL